MLCILHTALPYQSLYWIFKRGTSYFNVCEKILEKRTNLERGFNACKIYILRYLLWSFFLPAPLVLLLPPPFHIFTKLSACGSFVDTFIMQRENRRRWWYFFLFNFISSTAPTPFWGFICMYVCMCVCMYVCCLLYVRMYVLPVYSFHTINTYYTR